MFCVVDLKYLESNKQREYYLLPSPISHLVHVGKRKKNVLSQIFNLALGNSRDDIKVYKTIKGKMQN